MTEQLLLTSPIPKVIEHMQELYRVHVALAKAKDLGLQVGYVVSTNELGASPMLPIANNIKIDIDEELTQVVTDALMVRATELANQLSALWVDIDVDAMLGLVQPKTSDE